VAVEVLPGDEPEDVTPGSVYGEVSELLDYFATAHLPPHLAEISAPFGDLARLLVLRLVPGTELRAGLRKLLEAKDCAVRQAVRTGVRR